MMTKTLTLSLLLIIVLLLSACGALDSQSTMTYHSEYLSQIVSDHPMPVLTPVTSYPAAVTTTTSNTPPPFFSPRLNYTINADPPHPLTIDYLRQQDYPPSQIIIEETLEPGINYTRYIVSYRSEGLRIYALLTIPDGEIPENGWPVLVFNHGYIPPTQYRTTEGYITQMDAFARRGYIVFRSDYRGHGESQGVPIGAYGSPNYTIDILNALSALKADPTADSERIGMWGHSMGGWLTLRAMVVDPDIKAGVIWAGMVASYPDLLTKWRQDKTTPVTTPTGLTSRERWFNSFIDVFGDPEENPETWAQLSANSYLDQLSGPIQLHHGTTDNEIPLEFSTTLTEQIREAGGVVEYYTYEDDNHNISINFSDAIYRSLVFFDRYLK